jgi:melanoma-associated antigen
MVKKLVRLALASEYSRQPLRRSDITAKGAFDGAFARSPILTS